MGSTRKELLVIDEITQAVAFKIGADGTLFRHSQDMYMSGPMT